MDKRKDLHTKPDPAKKCTVTGCLFFAEYMTTKCGAIGGEVNKETCPRYTSA